MVSYTVEKKQQKKLTFFVFILKIYLILEIFYKELRVKSQIMNLFWYLLYRYLYSTSYLSLMVYVDLELYKRVIIIMKA